MIGQPEDLAPTTTELACEGASHRVTGRRGRLILDDHPNLTAERSVVALGGSVPGCLDVLKAWAEVRLPLSWLATVWAPKLALVDGCFVLDVANDTATVVRWDRVGPGVTEPVMVEARLRQDDNGGWHLRWR